MRKSLYFLALAVIMATLLTGCGNAETARDIRTNVFQNAGTADAKSLIESKSDLVVLDVRTPEEYASGHLADAVNIDVRAADFSDKVGALDKNKSYLVYCRTGKRSLQATDIMKGLGFTDVTNLTGGITQWQADGGATVQ
jgi:rhodanese-related sulfurtransferase